MARDRKKGRQRRRPRKPDAARERADVGGDDPLGGEGSLDADDLHGRDDLVAGDDLHERDDLLEDAIVHDDRADEPTAAPDPLAHSSAEVDIAEAAERAVETLDGPGTPLEADEYPHRDETEGADALEEERHPGAASGGELPREGNRFANFLRACVAELRRVQWPNRRQVGQATMVVLVFVIVAGGYLGLLDAVFSRLMNAIL
jgi:preprotein translocase SecE subunit